MTEVEKTTEAKILEAANTVFIRKGYSGASMQEIADEAGINKALLHYYFRSKEKLFRAGFSNVFSKFVPAVTEMMMSDKSFEEKMDLFVDNYIDTLHENPLIPLFVLQELNRDPDNLFGLMKSSGMQPQLLIKVILEEMEKGNIPKGDPRHFFINLLGLCVFPYAARPLMQRIFFDNDQEAYDAFLLERKKVIKNLIHKMINQK